MRQTGSVLPWIVAFVEGFSTLAVEVIAIRLAVPVVGSSMTLTGVMLGVVLFALSAGYWRGGALSARWDAAHTRSALSRNLLIAAVLYGAVAFPFEARLLDKALDLELPLPLAIGLSASFLFVPPIYLASQTVPMLAELINTEGKAGKASGKVLFFSTIGSVAGGIITPVFLFPNLGVERSTWVVCVLLAGAALAMGAARRRFGAAVAGAALVTSASLAAAPAGVDFVFDSAYQNIQIKREVQAENGRERRVLMMGGGRASGIYTDNGGSAFGFIVQAGEMLAESKRDKVLVIGAAGFTFPRDAATMSGVSRVDAVDVDPVVKDIAERQFLKQRLDPKIRFLPLSARFALHRFKQSAARYDFALLDAFSGRGIPEELLTLEFFRDVRSVADRAAANMIFDTDLESEFARNTLTTFRTAFGRCWVKRVQNDESELSNFLVTNWPAKGGLEWSGAGAIYTDDRNTSDRDRVRLLWGSE